MRREGSCSYLLLAVTIASGVIVSAAAVDEERSPLRKRNGSAVPAQQRTGGSVEDTPAEIDVVDAPAATTSEEEEEIRLLRLDDEWYWKKFMDHDGSIAQQCTFGVSKNNRAALI